MRMPSLVSIRQRHQSIPILLALLLVGSGLVSMPIGGQATATGLLAGKYGTQSVFSIDATTPTTCSGSTFTTLSIPLNSPLSLTSGEYLGLVEIADSSTEFVLRKFDSAGVTVTDVADRASVLGSSASGFVVRYEIASVAQQLFISNLGPLELASLDFTPDAAASTCVDPNVLSDKTQLQSVAAFAPTVNSVTPNSGSTAGGTEITITGTNFVPSYTSVRLGNIQATISEVTSTRIVATTGANTAGSATVVVEVGPVSSSESVSFSYQTPPPVLCAEAATARSEFKSGNLFLGGSYIELGISPVGNFGTSTTKPVGFFATPSDSRIGMSVDHDGFNCGKNFPIDFFLPGSPEERFAFGARETSSSTARYIGISQLGSISASGFIGTSSSVTEKTTITNLSTGTLLRAKIVTVVQATGGAEEFEITQDISFQETAMYFSNSVTVKNLTTSEYSSARFMRSFDPDNTVYQGGDYDTENTVLAQYSSDSYSAVRAQVTTGNLATDRVYSEFATRSPIVFYSADPQAKVSSFGFGNSNPYASSAFDSAPAKNFTHEVDGAITVTMEYGALAAGASKTKTYVTSLDLRDFGSLATELQELAQEAQSRAEVETPAETTPSSGGGSSGGLQIPILTPVNPLPSRPTTPRPSATSKPYVVPTVPAPTPSPSIGPVNLIPKVEATPGVVFGSTNPIPQILVDLLSKPLAYVLEELTGSPLLPKLTPNESVAFENGEAVEIRLVLTEQENGYSLIGDGWQVDLQAADSEGAPLRIDDSGNIILNQDRLVQFYGTGFAPGSIVKVWLFSEPTEVGDVLADASGNFIGQAQLPEGIPTGEHTVQLNGLTQDGQLRSVSLGVVVQPDPVIAPAPPIGFDLTGLMNLLWLLAAGVLFFFILWRRRKKDEEESGLSPIGPEEGTPIFASEGFEPTPQFPDDSRRKVGPAAPPNRKRFGFKPKSV